jgi:hypothetical protein
MTDYRILTAADALAIPYDFDVSHWNVGRSGDLGAGVEVWTSWLPVQGIYETLIHIPDALVDRFYQAFPHTSHTSTTRETALETHRKAVNDLQAWLAGVTA